jgi:hypothetical protein
MKKLHIILLEEPGKLGTPEDTITVYISKHGSHHEALLRMHMQGILPKFKVVSHTVVPAYRTLFEMMFPSIGVIRNIFGKFNLITWLKYWIVLPLKKLFKGSVRKNWQNIGQYDTVTKRVYPIPDGETLA